MQGRGDKLSPLLSIGNVRQLQSKRRERGARGRFMPGTQPTATDDEAHETWCHGTSLMMGAATLATGHAAALERIRLADLELACHEALFAHEGEVASPVTSAHIKREPAKGGAGLSAIPPLAVPSRDVTFHLQGGQRGD